MKVYDSTLLRIAGILEIFMGLLSVCFLIWISTNGEAGQIHELYPTGSIASLWLLAAMYGQAGLEILAGIAGIIFSKNRKRYRACIFIGYALMILSVVNFIANDSSIAITILQLLAMLILMLYLYGVQKNKDIAKLL